MTNLGLTDDQLTLFVIEQQSLAYKLRDQWLEAMRQVDEAHAVLTDKESEADYAKSKLGAVVTFLDAHNSEAKDSGESWLDLLDIDTEPQNE